MATVFQHTARLPYNHPDARGLNGPWSDCGHKHRTIAGAARCAPAHPDAVHDPSVAEWDVNGRSWHRQADHPLPTAGASTPEVFSDRRPGKGAPATRTAEWHERQAEDIQRNQGFDGDDPNDPVAQQYFHHASEAARLRGR